MLAQNREPGVAGTRNEEGRRIYAPEYLDTMLAQNGEPGVAGGTIPLVSCF